MTAEQFAYWLQGFMELTSMNHLSTTQFQIVKDHLALVFNKQTPDRKVPNVSTNPTWSQPTIPQWQEPNIVIEPSKLNPICSTDGIGTDLSKKFC
jgi:hypothetical protein